MRLKPAGYLLLFLLSATLVLLAPRPQSAAANTVTVNPVNTAPSKIYQSGTDDMARFTMTTDVGTALWSGIRVDRIGTAPDAAIGAVKIYKSPDAVWQSTDLLIGQGSMSGGQANITLTDQQTISTSVTWNYFIVYTMSSTAAINATVGAQLVSPGSVSFTVNATVAASPPLPFSSGTSTIYEAPDTMRLRGWNEAPITFTKPPAGTKLVSMLQLQPRTDTKETTWTALKVGKIGTLPAGGVTGVRVYSTTQTTQFDVSQNTLLGSAALDTTITFTTPQVVNKDTTTYYFVVFEINSSATTTQTVGARIVDKSYVTVGVPDEVAFISNLDSKISSIVGNPHGSPGNTGAYDNTNFCSACHNVHMAKTNRRILNKLVTRDPAIVNNSSATVYNALCFSCHDGTGASDKLQYYNPLDASSNQKGQGVTSPGHMTDQTGTIDTTGYLPNNRYNSGTMLPCMVCHDVHYSKWGNYALIADELYEYASSPSQTTSTTSTWDSSSTLWAAANPPSPLAQRKRCEVCHRNHVGTSDTTSSSGTGSWVDGKSVVVGIDLGRPGTHSAGGKASDWCGDCHGVHKITVGTLAGGSESSGGAACGTDAGGCHGFSAFIPMRETSTYHHYMQNADADVLASSGSKYPIKDTFTASDTAASERRCLMCHADHDAFSPVANPTYGDRAMNLRSSITTIPAPNDTASFSDSDYINDAGGGICLSCHKNSQVKNTTNQTGTAGQDSTTTPIIDRQQYADATTAHNYEASSTFEGTATEVTNRPFEFRANCVKCHNTIDNSSWPYNPAADVGSKQNSTFKFQLHSTEVRRLLAWLKIVSASQTVAQDPLEENFCNGCHSTNVADNPYAGSNKDYYNRAAMSAAALDIKSQIMNKTYGHKVNTGKKKHKAVEGQSPNWNPASNRHVECEDCHNVHAAKKGNHTQGSSAVGGPLKGVWGITATYTADSIQNNGLAKFTNNSAYVKADTVDPPNWGSPIAGDGKWYIKNNYDLSGRWYKIIGATSTTLTLSVNYASVYNGATFTKSMHLDPNAVDYTINKEATYAVTQSATNEYEVCLKCHTTYSFDSTAPPVPSGFTVTSSNATGPYETEIGMDFNPKQMAYHPVMAPGKNQPTDTANPNWADAQPYPIDDTSHGTYNGLSNTFVPPWKADSLVVCSDCHSNESIGTTQPAGPHGASTKWILKRLDTSIKYKIKNGTTIYYNNLTAPYNSGNLCVNCHRRDVYGVDGNNMPTVTQAALLSRQTHPPDNNRGDPYAIDAAGIPSWTTWPAVCMICHGGDGLGGGIHGTNAKRGIYDQSGGSTGVLLGGADNRGERFLNGAAWVSVTRSTALGGSNTLKCWTKNGSDEINSCTNSHDNGRSSAGSTTQYLY